MRRWRMNRGAGALLACMAVLCLWLATARQSALLEMRARYRLTPVEPLENAPPLVVFTTVVLGGFRGLVADALWLRMSMLQDAGKYFELVQLSDWITKLEPRSTEIWAFHAWNMAYNISVMMPEPEDRWRWVQNGIELIRDKGVAYNPGDPKLYFELAWLFQHKIGGTSDTAHLYYKRRWADEMSKALGGGRPDYSALRRDPRAAAKLRETYNLIPAVMETVDSEYGPLDWRLPETHAVYWAFRGRQQAGEERSLLCDRAIFQSLTHAFRQGRIVQVEGAGGSLTAPYPALLPKILRAFETARREHPDEPSITTGYENFLRDAVLMLHAYGRETDAGLALRKLRDVTGDPSSDTDPEAYVEAQVSRGVALATPEEASAMIERWLFQNLLWTCAGEADDARAAEDLAVRHWRALRNQTVARHGPDAPVPGLEELRERARRRAERTLPRGLLERLPPSTGEPSNP